jgi:tetratricopeptide (TPR) repeat protein
MRRKGIFMPTSHAFVRHVKFLAPFVLSFSLHAAQQAKSPASPSTAAPAPPQSHSDSKSDALKADISKYSQEPVVVEDLIVKIRFESDGRGYLDRTIRERIQTESAVTSEGLLPFEYASGDQSIDIKYVRVRKPDGSVVETPVDSAQDVTAEIARNAPMYTDLHEKHVAVRGLSVGDVLETRCVLTTTKPIAEGQFWSSYSFQKNLITLHEQLDIDVPADRAVKLHSPLITPEISEAAGRRIYSFQHTALSKPPEPDKFQAAVEGAPYPDVELSSFNSWDQVAAWYASLQKPRVQVTPELQAKALELTRDKKTEDEKIRALYDYVSTRVRYIGISLGIGRYQPHAAPDVLANGFGDCKDKHTLLAALLQSIGVNSYPVLIHSSIKLDPDVPTPAIFDHIITVIPKGDKFTWLDTTPGAAPFAVLGFALRDKLALVVMDGNKGLLTKTSKDIPFAPYTRFTMDAKLSKDGVLDGDARLESRGDSEILIRLAFRNTPESRWKELVQVLSQSLGFAGTVDDVRVAPPDDTSTAFWVTYKYHRPEYGDWPNHKIILPFAYFPLPQLSPDEERINGAIPLGALNDLTYEARVTLPQGFTPEVPAPVHQSNSFMSYDSTYKFSGSVLEGTRRLRVLESVVPPTERNDYVAISRDINSDENRWIALTTDALPPVFLSSNPDVQKLLADARQSMQEGAPHAASEFLEKAVKLDPKQANAWFLLGMARSGNPQLYSSAIDAFRKAIALEPSNVNFYAAMASIQWNRGKVPDTVQTWRDCVKAVPDDLKVKRNLSTTLIAIEDFAGAKPLLEDLAEANFEPPVTYDLAETYLHLGEHEEGMKLLQQMLDADPHGETLNSVAWALAETKYKLPDALKYAKQSVQEAEEQSSTKPGPLRFMMAFLAARWDTLGWVYFQMGDLDAAERYLAAAWKISPSGVVGGHLGDVYAKKGDNAKAVHTYSLALASLNPTEFGPVRDRLTAKTNSHGFDPKSTEQLQSRRTFTLKYSVGSQKSADFLVILAKDAKTNQINFVSGDESLRKLVPKLFELKFDIQFPDDGPTRLYQSATLFCSPVRQDCSFVLFDPPAKEMPQALESQSSSTIN